MLPKRKTVVRMTALLPLALFGAAPTCQSDRPAETAAEPAQVVPAVPPASSAPTAPATSPATSQAVESETFGARENPERGPIGGGEEYPNVLSGGDWLVRDAEQLLAALEQAQPGQVVYVADDARINMTGRQWIGIPGGVTLASGRGRDDCQGGLIFATELGDYKPEDRSRPLFVTGGPGIRLTGLRMSGPLPLRLTRKIWDLYNRGGKPLFYTVSNADGIHVRHADFEIDNCEMWGWSWSAVRLETGAANAHVHHNYIHHCQRQGLGYGVFVNQVAPLIESNRFDWCRHAIAGTGWPGTAYEACDNIIDANANSHSFDMHGGYDRKDGTDLAGDWVRIHHNTFRLTDQAAIGIRGIPGQIADIHHNRFAHETIEQAVRQKHVKGNMKLYSNTIRPPEQIVE